MWTKFVSFMSVKYSQLQTVRTWEEKDNIPLLCWIVRIFLLQRLEGCEDAGQLLDLDSDQILIPTKTG